MVQTTRAAVSSGVAVALAATLASSMASALASSTGAALGSASGSGGALPLLFGAQRFSLSSGLAVKKSPMQTGAANSLAWSTGKLGLVRGPTRPVRPTQSGRRLQSRGRPRAATDPNDAPNAGAAASTSNNSGNSSLASEEDEEELTPFAELLDVLALVGLIMAFLVVLRAAILVYWSRFANARYYWEGRQKKFEESKSPHGHPLYKARLTIRKKHGREKRRRSATFKSLPASLVFPNMEFLIYGIFSAGLTEGAVASLGDASCEGGCVGVCVLTLIVMGLAFIAGFAQVIHFYWRHCRASWSENTVDAARDVEDPVLRLISKLRQRYGLSPLGRERGGYEAPEEDSEEPARTERLLASPFSLLHSNAGDACDAMSTLWLSRSSGNISGVFYDLFSIALMLGLGVALGLEDVASQANWSAITQAVIVFILQACLALYVLMLSPSIDRIDNFQTWVQLMLEATATFLLLSPLISGSEPSGNTAKLSAFVALILALLAVFLPVITRIYDVVVVPFIEWVLAGADCRKLIALLVHMVCMIPGCVLGLLGCDVADIADAGLENVSSYHLDVPEEQGKDQDEEPAEAEDKLEQPRHMRKSTFGSDADEEVDAQLSINASSIREATAPTTALPSQKDQFYDIQVVVVQDRAKAVTAAVVIQKFARGHYGRVRLRKQAATAAKISRTLQRARAAKKKSRMRRSSTLSMLQPVEGRAESSPTPRRGRVTVVRRRSTRSRSRVTMEENVPAATPAVHSTTSSASLEDDATRFAAPARTLSHADRTDHLVRSFLEVARQAKQKREASHCATTNTESAQQPGEKRPALTRTSSSSFGVGF